MDFQELFDLYVLASEEDRGKIIQDVLGEFNKLLDENLRLCNNNTDLIAQNRRLVFNNSLPKTDTAQEEPQNNVEDPDIFESKYIRLDYIRR